MKERSRETANCKTTSGHTDPRARTQDRASTPAVAVSPVATRPLGTKGEEPPLTRRGGLSVFTGQEFG